MTISFSLLLPLSLPLSLSLSLSLSLPPPSPSLSLQDTAVPTVHYVGAFLVFGFGVLCGWGQTLFGIKLFRAGHTPFLWRCTLVIRLLLCVAASVFFITCE